MQQERLMILKMLAEGKVTPEEADSLLDSLEAKSGAARTSQQGTGGGECFAEGVAGFASRVAAWGAEFGAKVAEEIGDGRVPVLRWLGDCFNGHETTTERTGEFDREEVTVECSCEAGSFFVRGVEEDGYALTVKQRFGSAEGPAIKQEGDRLCVRGNGIVRGELLLPRKLRYRLELRSSAGRVEVDDLTLCDGAIRTDAGSIRLANLVAAGGLKIKSHAGTIEGTGLTAREISAESDCGRIHLALLPTVSGRCRVETDVGAVSLVVPASPGVGYHLRAKAGVGSISCSPELAVREECRAVGQRSLVAETPGYTERACQVEIEVRTDCGSIRLSAQ